MASHFITAAYNGVAPYTAGSTTLVQMVVTGNTQTVTYVSGTFAGDASSQVIPDADLGTAGNQPAVFGVNAFTNSEPSPLAADENSIHVPSAAAEAEQVAQLVAWRAQRDEARVREALRALRKAAASGANIMAPSIEAAKAGATTGEWGDALRAEFGIFRAPTGVSPRARQEAADLDPLLRTVLP